MEQKQSLAVNIGLAIIIIFMLGTLIRACQLRQQDIPVVQEQPSPTATLEIISPLPTPTATATIKPLAPTVTPTPTWTPIPPTETPSPSPTATPTDTPEPTATPFEYIVNEGDWLSKIADRYTGDYSRWPEIVYEHDEAAQLPENQHLRPNLFENPDLILTGEVLRLPQKWSR